MFVMEHTLYGLIVLAPKAAGERERLAVVSSPAGFLSYCLHPQRWQEAKEEGVKYCQ